MKFYKYTSLIKSAKQEKILSIFRPGLVFLDSENICLFKEVEKNIQNLSEESLGAIFSCLPEEFKARFVKNLVAKKKFNFVEKAVGALTFPEKDQEGVAKLLLDNTSPQRMMFFSSPLTGPNEQIDIQVKLFRSFFKKNCVQKNPAENLQHTWSQLQDGMTTGNFSPPLFFATSQKTCAENVIERGDPELLDLFIKEADLSFDLIEKYLPRRQLAPVLLETAVRIEERYGFDNIQPNDVFFASSLFWKTQVPEARAIVLKKRMLASLPEKKGADILSAPKKKM